MRGLDDVTLIVSVLTAGIALTPLNPRISLAPVATAAPAVAAIVDGVDIAPVAKAVVLKVSVESVLAVALAVPLIVICDEPDPKAAFIINVEASTAVDEI